MEIEVSTDRALLDMEMIVRYLSEESYWARGRSREIIERSLANSICFGGYDNGHQIAFARAVTDRATFAYLADVFVVDGYRGRGAGKIMIAAVLAHPDLQVGRFMLATRDAHELYTQFGFRPLAAPERWMETGLVPAN